METHSIFTDLSNTDSLISGVQSDVTNLLTDVADVQTGVDGIIQLAGLTQGFEFGNTALGTEQTLINISDSGYAIAWFNNNAGGTDWARIRIEVDGTTIFTNDSDYPGFLAPNAVCVPIPFPVKFDSSFKVYGYLSGATGNTIYAGCVKWT
jgi:hypothetical protein